MKLLVGLGNPEERYFGTRHNIGFEVVNALARKLATSNKPQELSWENRDKFKSEIIQGSFILNSQSLQLILAKPQTYMNKSGLAVASLVNYFKIKPEDILVVHDELDLLLGHIKIRLGGSDAGHHGLESIIKSLGTDKFVRVRLGIGVEKTLSGEHKQVAFNAEHFVMEPFLPKERSKVKSVIKRAVNAIEAVLTQGWQKAQNQFN